MSSGSRLASGNGASTRSINSTVATEVGLTTGVRSTGSRRSAARVRSRLVICVGARSLVTAASLIVASSLLLARRGEEPARRAHLFLPQRRADVERPDQEKPDESVVVLP